MTDHGGHFEGGGFESGSSRSENSGSTPKLTPEEVGIVGDNSVLIGAAVEQYRTESLGYRLYVPQISDGSSFGDVDLEIVEGKNTVLDSVGSDGSFLLGYRVSGCLSMTYNNKTGQIFEAKVHGSNEPGEEFKQIAERIQDADVLHVAFVLEESRFGVEEDTYEVFPYITTKPDHLVVFMFDEDYIGIPFDISENPNRLIALSLGECSENLRSL